MLKLSLIKKLNQNEASNSSVTENQHFQTFNLESDFQSHSGSDYESDHEFYIDDNDGDESRMISLISSFFHK